jgi:DNA-binding MarR family transcriptional regulator
MTISLYQQLIAYLAHAERLRAENPPPQTTVNELRTLQALKEAGRPMTSKQVSEVLGSSQRTTFGILHRLRETGQVERKRRYVRGHLTNFWNLVDDAE